MKKIITAKEQFENEVKNMVFVDEVCEYDYYYKEEDGKAIFCAGNEGNGDYLKSIYPTFFEMKKLYGIQISCHFIEQEISSIKELRRLMEMTTDELVNDRKFFVTYCDFLFSDGGNMAIDGFCFKDKEEEVPDKSEVIGAICTDLNAISSMVAYLKSDIIERIKGIFDCLEVNEIEMDKTYDGYPGGYCTDSFSLYITCKDNKVMLKFVDVYDKEEYFEYLDQVSLDDLLIFYEQLHK